MRITGGEWRGRKLPPFGWKGTKPTTDKVRQALFNILQNRIELKALKVLDCFAGTGVVGLEFLSRGAERVTSLDKNHRCVSYMKRLKSELNLARWDIKKGSYQREFTEKNSECSYDLIFADPPYDMEGIEVIPELIFSGEVLLKNGIFVLEHRSTDTFPSEFHWMSKAYGESTLSFYTRNQ